MCFKHIAKIIAGILVVVVGKLIPNKYADILWHVGNILQAGNNTAPTQSKEKILDKYKKVVPVLLLMFLSTASFSQNAFRGFFDKKQDVLSQKLFLKSTDTLSTTSKGSFLFRGAATVAGFAMPLKSSEEVSSFQIAGMGLSYGYYTSSTYCKYAINAFAVSSLKLGDLSSAKAGGLLTVGFFNNYVNIGVMYAAPSSTYNWYLTTGLTYTF